MRMRTRSIRASRAVTFALALAGALAVVPYGFASAQDDQASFAISQDVPALAVVARAETGASPGDMLAFEASITHEDGREGVLRGLLVTVDIPDATGDLLEDRVGQLVFDLGEGNSLVVAGASVYESQADEMTPGAPQVRAVVGGTGQYIGARGEVETIRNADGSYEHVFTLLG